MGMHIYKSKPGLPDVFFDADEWVRLREARKARGSQGCPNHPVLEACFFDYFPGIQNCCDCLLLWGPWDNNRARLSCIISQNPKAQTPNPKP